MLGKSALSPFANQWSDGPEGLLIRGGLTLVAIGTTGYILNKVFNSSPIVVSSVTSPTTDGALGNRAYSAAVKEHLRATYAHFAGGLVLTGGFAYLSHRAGWSKRLMAANVWVSVGGTLLFSIASGFATQMINQHQNPVWKYATWVLFNSSFGLTLSPLCYLESSLLARAALLSAGVVASVSAVGMTAQREKYLWLGAPLLAGISVIGLASIGSIILPATAIRASSVLESISLYGGLAIFCGVLLFDTQKLITNAEKAQDTRTLSSINESLDIYLDTINIFIRIVTLLIKEDERKKKRPASTI